MKKAKKKVIRIAIILFGLVLFLGIAHSIVLPQKTKCHLIKFYDFEKSGYIYYRKDVPKEIVKQLIETINQAEVRVRDFWGRKKSQPIFIYCNDKEDYRRFGSTYNTPACANMELVSYVVINKNGLNLDIISHELNHTELYARVGHIKRELEIPVWFDEGLAMQVDFRDSYSTDSLKKMSNNFTKFPDVRLMNTYKEFANGTEKEIHFNYATAKYEVENWYTDKRLKTFIENIRNGMSFNEAINK